MEKLNGLLRKILYIGAFASLMLTTACSDVGFQDVASAASKVETGEPTTPTPEPTPVTPLEEDSFVQRASDTPVDIIVVVDDSPSMSGEQKKLGERIGSFISSLDGVDWRIAITTTDVSDKSTGLKGNFVEIEGTGTNILSYDTPDYQNKFLQTVKRKASASSSEQPLEATVLAVSKANTENAGFFRDGASLSVIYISDEDERSTGGRKATKPATVLNAVKSVWSKKAFTAYGIIVEPGDYRCLDKGGSVAKHRFGTHVSELARLTGGLTGSLCDDDYGPTLSAIGKKVRKLNDTFKLKAMPDKDSLTISMDPYQDMKWKMEGDSIVFERPPMDNTKISIKYKKLK